MNHNKNCICHECEMKEGRTHRGDGSVSDPVPRFKRIENGICPDCDNKLNDGYCVDCHIVPALDPGFQAWLTAPQTLFDSDGNQFSVKSEVITVTTPDGYTSTSETAQDALAGAVAKREAARTSWTPQSVKVKFPAGLALDDMQYWSGRASEIEGSPIVLAPKICPIAGLLARLIMAANRQTILTNIYQNKKSPCRLLPRRQGDQTKNLQLNSIRSIPQNDSIWQDFTRPAVWQW